MSGQTNNQATSITIDPTRRDNDMPVWLEMGLCDVLPCARTHDAPMFTTLHRTWYRQHTTASYIRARAHTRTINVSGRREHCGVATKGEN